MYICINVFTRAEIQLLQRVLCSNTTDDSSCRAFLPDFWTAIAKELYPVAWSHICDDIADTCAEHGPPRPTCEACTLRVKWMVEYLKDGEVQAWWLDNLTQGSFCSSNYAGNITKIAFNLIR